MRGGRLLAFVCLVGVLAHHAPAADAPDGIKVVGNLQYVPNGDPAQVLDLYLPKNAGDKPLPLIIWIHGGAWKAGDRFNGSAVPMATHGYAVAAIEYRFSQKAVFPAQIQDCQAAVRWLRANAATYGIDPDHIGVWGSSAGGHLAALLGTAGGSNAFPPIGGNEKVSDRVQAVCDFYGPADFTTVIDQAAKEPVKNVFHFNAAGDPYSALIGAPLGDNDKSRLVSPVHFVDKSDPPFIIFHGTKDALVPFAQSVELDAALRQAGVDSTLQRIPDAGHGGGEFRLPVVRKLILCFFDKHLKGTQVKIEALPESAFEWKPATTRGE